MDAEQNPAFITISSITPDDDPNIGLDDIDCAIRHKFGMETDELTVIIVCHMPIVARMAAILDGLSPSGFELAECRVFGTEVIAPNLLSRLPNSSQYSLDQRNVKIYLQIMIFKYNMGLASSVASQLCTMNPARTGR